MSEARLHGSLVVCMEKQRLAPAYPIRAPRSPRYRCGAAVVAIQQSMQTRTLDPSLSPEPEPTFERIFVLPSPRSAWQAVDLVRVTSTQDHVIRLECRDET